MNDALSDSRSGAPRKPAAFPARRRNVFVHTPGVMIRFRFPSPFVPPFAALALAAAPFAVPSLTAQEKTTFAAESALKLPDPDVKQRIDAFFATLRQRKVADAYDKLFAGSGRAAEEPEVFNALVEATAQVVNLSGEIGAPELVRVRSTGKTLREATYVLNASKRPVLWRFYLYFSEGKWQVLDTTVATRATAFFEDGDKEP